MHCREAFVLECLLTGFQYCLAYTAVNSLVTYSLPALLHATGTVGATAAAASYPAHLAAAIRSFT